MIEQMTREALEKRCRNLEDINTSLVEGNNILKLRIAQYEPNIYCEGCKGHRKIQLIRIGGGWCQNSSTRAICGECGDVLRDV